MRFETGLIVFLHFYVSQKKVFEQFLLYSGFENYVYVWFQVSYVRFKVKSLVWFVQLHQKRAKFCSMAFHVCRIENYIYNEQETNSCFNYLQPCVFSHAKALSLFFSTLVPLLCNIVFKLSRRNTWSIWHKRQERTTIILSARKPCGGTPEWRHTREDICSNVKHSETICSAAFKRWHTLPVVIKINKKRKDFFVVKILSVDKRI